MSRVFFWLESAASCVCGVLVALTLVSRDWVEELSGLDPDRSNGAVEWALVAALALTTIYLSLGARRRWREIHARALG